MLQKVSDIQNSDTYKIINDVVTGNLNPVCLEPSFIGEKIHKKIKEIL